MLVKMTLPVDEGYPLSTQQALAFRLQRQLGCAPCMTITIDDLGEVSLGRVQQAVDRVSSRHEILRTLYQEVPGLDLPLQVVLPRPQYSISHADSSAPVVDPLTGPLFDVAVSHS